MVSLQSRSTPPLFGAVMTAIASMQWRDGLEVDEIGSPQRIAPHSVALTADLMSDGEPCSNGRLILLHDPAGNDAWDGTYRLVSYVRADVDVDMVADPLLPDVAWTWLTDALDAHGASHHALAGTVTASFGRSFGDMEGADEKAEVEVRSSWTPDLNTPDEVVEHLRSWQDLLGHIGGTPPLPAGVVAFPGRA